jgi:hypothetical protein
MTSTTVPGVTDDRPNRNSRLSRLFDGGHPWGELFVGFVDRAGGVRYHLTVYPAGITPAQRRALVFRRRWIPWGAVIWFLVSSGLGTMMNGWVAFALGGAIYIGALMISTAYAGPARAGTVELYAQLLSLMGHREVLGDLDLLKRESTRLLQLDELAETNTIDPVTYELLWGEVYDEIVASQS